MKRENFYRRDPGAALSGMAGMSLEERGVYNTIIDLLYLTWRPLEDSAAYIAGHCGCAVQKLNPILRRLIEAGKLVRFEEDGRSYISNPTFERERAAVKGASQSRSGRALRGENSAGVGEKSGEAGQKSAGVEKNPPGCKESSENKQTLTPLEKSREDKTRHSVPDGTGAEAPPPDLKKRAFDAALAVLMDGGGMRRNAAAGFLGRLNKDFDLSPEEMLGIAESAERLGTPDPAAYFRKAATGVVERRSGADRDPMLFPSEERQRMWMDEYRERKSSWSGNRGPRPGERGCRVSSSIQRAFGICPFGEKPDDAPDLLSLAQPDRRVA